MKSYIELRLDHKNYNITLLHVFKYLKKKKNKLKIDKSYMTIKLIDNKKCKIQVFEYSKV